MDENDERVNALLYANWMLIGDSVFAGVNV